MAKEKFMIVAVKAIDDCYTRFSESDNRAAIEAGTADTTDPYSWVEASFEIRLVRYREATHICSFTPSAYYIWLQNYFVGIPNEAWIADGDPEGLENENGDEYHGYGTYRDDYDPRFVCETFTIDTMRDLDGLRKPSRKASEEKRDAYHAAIWKAAEEYAHDSVRNGINAKILETMEYRKWEKEKRDAVRREALNRSRFLQPGQL